MSKKITAQALEFLSGIPLLGVLFRKLPFGFIHRFGLFTVIGGLSVLVRLVAFEVLVSKGDSTLVASITSVELSLLFNFTANRFITWRDRFDEQSVRQNVVGFVLLLLLFHVNPSIPIKMVCVDPLSKLQFVSPTVAVLFLEGVGLVINYLIADKIFFKYSARLIQWNETRKNGVVETSAIVQDLGT